MRSAPSLPVEADVLLKTAQFAAFERVCLPITTSTDKTELRLAALLALGTARFDAGNVVGSIEKLEEAHTGSQADRDGIGFTAAMALFSRQSQFQSPADSLPLLTLVRQLANASGTARSLGNLHLVVARLEACRGLCVDARRHLEIGRRLLAAEPAAVRCSVLLVDSALELFAGNLLRASNAAKSGLEIAGSENLTTLTAGCLANLGTVTLFLGRPGRARELLGSALKICTELLLTRFSVLDALAQVELFEGNLEACGRTLRDCASTLCLHRVPARSWYDLAHQLTRCAYYERLEDWTQIVAIADEVDPELARRQYKALRTSLLCAKARALARLRQHTAAQACLTAAVKVCPRGAVDPLIALEASKGVCEILGGNPGAGSRHFDRALAACRAIGHRYHERWIERTRAALAGPSPRAIAPAGLDTTEAALLLTDVATILGAGHSVDLMAMRTLSLLENTPLRPRIQVDSASGCEYQANPSATTDATPDGGFSLRLRGSDRQIAITVSGRQTLEEMSLLKSVADIAQIAVTRTVDTEHEDDEQNLWPRADVDTDDDVVFRSPRMVELRKIAIRLAETDLPVFITGETGTGKEIFARLIHDHSKHHRGPFVPFNCSAIPRDLMESQLFGHRRGAFTGAGESFPGVIRAAERGTLFLDEIGDLDLASQPKLLRFLESGEVHPLGDLRAHRVPVRIVAATNASIEDAMRTGHFRRDLFYRLGVAQLALPALRERKDEIPALVNMFVTRSARECGRSGVTIGDDFVAALLLYDWPGNIRELVNEIRRVTAMAADGDTLTAAMINPTIAAAWNARPVAATGSGRGGFFVRMDQPLARAIDEVEEQFIEHALKSTGGRVADAANLLGISRKGLFLKRRRRGLVSTADGGTV